LGEEGGRIKGEPRLYFLAKEGKEVTAEPTGGGVVSYKKKTHYPRTGAHDHPGRRTGVIVRREKKAEKIRKLKKHYPLEKNIDQ